MSGERRLHAGTGLLCLLAWGLEAQASWAPPLVLATLTLSALLVLRLRIGVQLCVAWVGLVLYWASAPALLRQVPFPELQRPVDPASAVAETMQARFSALEQDLASWSRLVASHPGVRDTLSAYDSGTVSLAQAQRRLFELLPALSPPAKLSFAQEFLGLSVHGPSHELLAWSGNVVESFDADLDQVEAEGATFYIEELSLSSIKVFVPVSGANAATGLVAVDLIIQKPGSIIEIARFPQLVELLRPPPGYSIRFTPKDLGGESGSFEASSSQAALTVHGLSGEDLGTLTVLRLESLPGGIRIRIMALREALWPLLMLWMAVTTFAAWSARLGSQSRGSSLLGLFLLGLYLGMGLLSAHELLWVLRTPVISSLVPHRLSAVVALWILGGWISLRRLGPRPVNRLALRVSALFAGILFHLLLTAGFRFMVYYVQQTSIEVWSPVRPTEVIPRLLGHFTILTAFAGSVFALAALLPSRRSLWSLTPLFAGGILALASGASLLSTALLGLATAVLASLLDDDFARLRLRLLPAALGGLFFGLVLVAAYYPQLEAAALQTRQLKAQDLALRMLQERRVPSGVFLDAELERLLQEPGLCQDLARKDDELLSGLAAHYWVESGLSEQRAWQSSLTVLRFDGTPVSSFSTAVQESGRLQAEFLTDLIGTRQKTSRVIDLEDRTLQFLGAPVRCGGVQVGFLVLSLVAGDFVRFSSRMFEPGEVRAVELKNGAVVDPDDPRLLPPIVEGERQVGGRRFHVRLLPVTGHENFDQLAVLVRFPTEMKRLYSFLWAGLGSAVYLVLGLILSAAGLRLVRHRSSSDIGLVLRFADKIFLGFLAVSLVPVLIIAPVYRRILEDRLESTLKERGSAAADAAEIMILEKGTDNALALADRILDRDGRLSSDPGRHLSRDPVISWSLYDSSLLLTDGDAFQPHEILKPPAAQLREAVALGQSIPSFTSSQGQTVLQVVVPLFHFEQGENRLLAVLCVALQLFKRTTDELLLKVQEILGYEVELYSRDAYLQASSRWPDLQISSPSRRIHSEAYYFIGVLGGNRHTVIRKEAEQYRTFTTSRACLDRDKSLSGFLAVSIGLSAGEELASELRNMGLIIFLVAFVGFLLSTLVATLLVSRISSPLRELMRGTSRVAEGDLQIQLQRRGDDEIARLVDSFNSMVAQLRTQRDELARTHRLAAWGEAARRVAHEIKNPLTPILLSTQHLRQVWEERSPKFDQLFYRCTDTIIEQVKSLQHIATEFSSFARLPAPKLEPGQLNEAVQSAVSVFQGSVPERIRFELQLHQGATPCQLDQEAVSRAVVNLIQNAIHAIEDEGTVRVATRLVEGPEGRFVRLSVSDTGAGIPEEILPRLFEPYFSTKVQGTGLGLAISKRTFDDHHCRVHVHTQAGHGSTFDIDFPALEAV